MTRKEIAMQSFLDGYNCAQCLMLAFEDLLTVDIEKALKVASPFGGGMGRLREVCGSVTGMFLVLGYVCGYDDPADYYAKKCLYEHVQELAYRFEKIHGSIVCRELLELNTKHDSPTPDKRTPEYYASRPCTEKIGSAAEILEAYLIELGIITI